MSNSKALLHGDGLLRALTETALEVQRARFVDELLAAAGAGLEKLGMQVAVVSMDEAGYWLRYLTAGPHLEQLKTLLLPASRQMLLGEGSFRTVTATEEPVRLTQLRASIAAFHLASGSPPAPVDALALVPDVGAIAPLHVRHSQWGALVVMHDELREDDLAILRLFALQLGSAIEVSDGFERLERRTAELDLVHELAVSGPRTDSRAMCRRALETVCKTTQSDSGMLHRFDVDSGDYVLVGDAFGYEGRLVEDFRRFRIDPENPLARSPLAAPAKDLPVGSEVLQAEGIAHMAVVPLAIEGKPVGLLSLARSKDLAYGEADVRSAEILGVQMASLLERARLYDEANRLYGDLKTSYDELARTQQELVRHERLAALGELAAVMAHEVRNPLGVIFNSLTTLKRLLRPTGDAEMLLNMVGEEADRLNRIVGDLLDFVRPYELVKKPMAVEPIIASAVDAAAQSMLNSNVRVLTEFPKELPAFPLDSHLLKQALVNLIVNAAQAMPKGGTVTVRATVESMGGVPWLTVRVRDEGVGLSPRATAKMFQPFFTTKATGTGLGLAVVKRIVDAHLGEVTAKGNDDGEGTTFTVRFPPTTETRSGALTPPRPSPAIRRG
jgi:signal transduction histidine kinase